MISVYALPYYYFVRRFRTNGALAVYLMSAHEAVPACRRLIPEYDSLATPKDPETPLDRRFFPKVDLKNLFGPSTIQAVLDCRCNTCRHRIETVTDLPVASLATVIADSFTLVFALLVYIECPKFIFAFLHRDWHDDCIEDLAQILTGENIRQNFWPKFDQKNRKESISLAEKFRWGRYRFAVPYFNDSSYKVYDESTIFPFMNEKLLGRRTENGEIIQEGAFSQVYSFEIIDEYRKFPVGSIKSSVFHRVRKNPTDTFIVQNAEDVKMFARKELRCIPDQFFNRERTNLERVNKLQDPHIVRVLKAYKHGKSYNLIFPLAKTNLDQYLRDINHHAPDTFQSSPECSPLWTQLLGVFTALDRIINYNLPGEQGASAVYGYHFDLKPANILIEDSGRFIISDFGQANFKLGGGTSQVTGMGGTPAYAPPETDGSDNKPNRKYDIWSLGCILLEVCAFVVGGFEGVRNFDALKVSRSLNVEDDRFFIKKVHARSYYEVKPQIVSWMKRLPKTTVGLREHSRKFLRKLMELAKDMVCVSVAERLTSTEARDRLESLLLQFQPVQRGSQVEAQAISILCPPKDQQWKDVPVRILEDSSKFITIVDTNDLRNRKASIGPRSGTALIAQYAMGTERSLGFVSSDDEVSIHPSVGTMSFRDTKGVLMMQSILTGQGIRCSLNLLGGKIEPKLSLKDKFKPGASMMLTREELGSNAVVQLWSEEPHDNPDQWVQRKNFPRSLEDFFSKPTFRTVIYHNSVIISIPLAKNVRMEKQATTDLSTFRLIPTDKLRDPTFFASAIPMTQNHTSLPLDRTELDAKEQKGHFECKSIQLNFRDATERAVFARKYTALKKEWSENEKIFATFVKEHMGEKVGWAPN